MQASSTSPSYEGEEEEKVEYVSDASLDAEAAVPTSVLTQLQAFAARGGGLVVNAAITVDGCQPLGTRVKKVTGSSPLSLIIRTRVPTSIDAPDYLYDGAPGKVASTLTVTNLADLADYNQPHAEGAIVKCALLCLGVVRLPTTSAFAVATTSPTSAEGATTHSELSEQLQASLGAGLEVETWSLLPHGSGLGSSSILASTVLAAIARALDVEYDLRSLNHMVLKVEQMLSTGGGWQDQVGGMWPGIKASSCAAALPVNVDVLALNARAEASVRQYAPTLTPLSPPLSSPPDAIHDLLNNHLFLIYTGKTRLAKNLLQRVLRQWSVRENAVTERVAALRSNAVHMAAALVGQDLAAVGHALDVYWQQKQGMAPMAEPPEASAIISALRANIHGCSLAGAGGGGFLLIVTKTATTPKALSSQLASTPATAGLEWSVHTCAIDTHGLNIRVD
jgi:fucokinase